MIEGDRLGASAMQVRTHAFMHDSGSRAVSYQTRTARMRGMVPSDQLYSQLCIYLGRTNDRVCVY